MFIDASALTAMMINETDAYELVARMQRDKRRITSPLAIWETGIAVSRELALSIEDTVAAIEEYIQLMDIEVAAVPAATGIAALDVFRRYGKGRHPARLNFGDCFAYACARDVREPLMFKGEDFSQTDIEAA